MYSKHTGVWLFRIFSFIRISQQSDSLVRIWHNGSSTWDWLARETHAFLVQRGWWCDGDGKKESERARELSPALGNKYRAGWMLLRNMLSWSRSPTAHTERKSKQQQRRKMLKKANEGFYGFSLYAIMALASLIGKKLSEILNNRPHAPPLLKSTAEAFHR